MRETMATCGERSVRGWGAVHGSGKALLVVVLLLSVCSFTPGNKAGAWVCAGAGSSPTAVPGPFSSVSTVCFAPWAAPLTTSRNTVTSDIPSFAINSFLVCYLLPGTFLIHLFAFKWLFPALCLLCLTYP